MKENIINISRANSKGLDCLQNAGVCGIVLKWILIIAQVLKKRTRFSCEQGIVLVL
jgi:hypothetical protein